MIKKLLQELLCEFNTKSKIGYITVIFSQSVGILSYQPVHEVNK